METQLEGIMATISEGMERIASAAALLEKTVGWIEQREEALSGDVRKIVATVEQSADFNRREQQLEEKLSAALEQIAELRAQSNHSQRKTIPATAFQLLAKQGTGSQEVETGTLDAALAGLSLEQRIAVKSKLMRAGTLT
jgi:predicted  nucleic acid-binding Zn-ribbon protein